MRIAIDIDDVTIASTTAWLEQYHPQCTILDIYKYAVWKISEMKCTKEEFYEEFDNLDSQGITLLPYARDTIKKLQLKHDIYFLTDKTLKQLKWTKEVLVRENLDDIQLITSWNKSKNEFEYDVLIDDSPVIAKEVGSKCILYTRPWNNTIKHVGPRITNWLQIEQVLNNINNSD